MLRTNRLLSLPISGLLLAGMTLAANADTIILGPNSVTNLTDFNGSFLVTQFNPALGTLNSVFLTLGTNFTTQLVVTNNSIETASSGNASTVLQSALYDATTTFTTPFNVLTPSGGLFNLVDSQSSAPQGYNLVGGGSVTLNPPSKTGSLSSAPNFTSGPVLSYFTGAGNASVSYRTFTSTALNNTGGNTAATQTTTDTLSATVQYNYTPASTDTPEPGTWAMLAAGASTGLVALRRRRNKK